MNYYVQRPLSLNHILMKVNCFGLVIEQLECFFWGLRNGMMISNKSRSFYQSTSLFLDVNIYLNIYIDAKNLNFKNVFIQTQVLSSQNQNLRNSISCAYMQLKNYFAQNCLCYVTMVITCSYNKILEKNISSVNIKWMNNNTQCNEAFLFYILANMFTKSVSDICFKHMNKNMRI